MPSASDCIHPLTLSCKSGKTISNTQISKLPVGPRPRTGGVAGHPPGMPPGAGRQHNQIKGPNFKAPCGTPPQGAKPNYRSKLQGSPWGPRRAPGLRPPAPAPAPGPRPRPPAPGPGSRTQRNRLRKTQRGLLAG
jgi:hypothetical protein